MVERQVIPGALAHRPALTRIVQELLHRSRQGMTARTVNRLLKVARTIADLLDRDDIDEGCILEAASYRALDSDPGVDSRRFMGPAAAAKLCAAEPGVGG